MSTTFPTTTGSHDVSPFDVLPDPHGSATTTAVPTRRARWPIAGVIAGVAGVVSILAALSNSVSEEDAGLGAGVVDKLNRGSYHLSYVLGIVAFSALFVAATAWKRWAEHRAPRDLAARTIGAALTATATINIVFTALAGSLALYLPGGTDHGWLSDDALFVNFTLLDFGQMLGWWGGMVAAGCVASLALRRQRVLPRWMGVVSLLLVLPPLAIAATTGLPGLPGVFMPVWLVVTSIGMIFSRTARA